MSQNPWPVLSVVTPCHNEAKNVPLLFERLTQVFSSQQLAWEWLIIDDHSQDDTFSVAERLAKAHPQKVRLVRLSRNWGSHMAILCGVRKARGQGVVVMAADLQDPPEVLPQMIESWRSGAQVVWAAREQRSSESIFNRWFAELYHRLLRRLIGKNNLPAGGVDFFLIDQKVAKVLASFKESRVSVFALIAWMGFRQKTIQYKKAERLHGQSSWSLRRKLRLVLDSITSFSYAPIRFLTVGGIVVAALGAAYAAFVVVRAFDGRAPEGWSSLMVVVLLLGGLQMLMMGVLGEYLWRGLEESRARPNYVVEDHVDFVEQESP